MDAAVVGISSLSIQDAVVRSAQTGTLALDGRNLSVLPASLLTQQPLPSTTKSGKSTACDFESSGSGWWQYEPVSKLSISRNCIEEIPRSLIEDCHETLQHLDLSYNKLTSLPSNVLRHCVRLKYVNVSHNRLTALCALPSSVVVLDVGFNNLETLPSDLMLPSPMLVEFRAAENKLRELPASFAHMNLLNLIDVRGNKLDGAAMETIAHACPELRDADVSQNEIQTLSEDLGLLRKLRRLDAHENWISALPASITALTELAELHMRMNRIKDLSSVRNWQQLRSLRVVDLSENKLAELPSGIAKLPALAVLDVSNNDVRGLPLELGTCTSLRRLVLHGNCIRSIRRELLEGETSDLLRYLARKFEKRATFGVEGDDDEDASNTTYGGSPGGRASAGGQNGPRITPVNGRIAIANDSKLKTFPTVTDFRDVITAIDLPRNAITLTEADCEALCALPCLVELNLSRNKVTRWPFSRTATATAAPMVSLKHLDLSFNPIPLPSKDEPLGLRVHCPSIEHLALSGITSPSMPVHIAHDISALPRLRELILERCALQQFPKSLLAVKGLRRLSLSENKIAELPTDITRLSHLTFLDMRSNDVSKLPAELGLMDATLSTLLVEGNPLRSIRRAIIDRGTAAVLEYLRNKLPIPAPSVVSA